MRCRHYKGFASAYLDGQLTQHETVTYWQHREACGACRVELTELRQLSLLLKSAEQPEAPSQLRYWVKAVIAVE
jgi:anti-sigma factor RsiW